MGISRLTSVLLDPWTVTIGALLVTLVAWVFVRNRAYWTIFYSTIGRDVIGLFVLVRIKLSLFRYKRQNASVTSLFKENVARHPDKVLFYYEDERWTYKDVDVFSNQVANCFSSMGYAAGDEVTLFMAPRPEYVGIWLGLAKIGVIPALINTGLRNNPLISSIGVVAKTKALIYGSELADAVKEVGGALKERNLCLEHFNYGDVPAPGSHDLKRLLRSAPTTDPDHKPNFNDKLLYIYTSGTTGLPKAAIIRHSRYIMLAAPNFMPGMYGQKHTIYCTMPLYHSLGGGVAIGLALIHGHSVVIRKTFSARSFWSECKKYKCTMFVYVGEVCRYLLAQADKDADTEHEVRLMLGVGLRPSIWSQFTKRFAIKRVLEFYGSTEGNFQIVNLTKKVGACGFLPQTAPTFVFNKLFPSRLIKVNAETGEPERDGEGLCIACKPGEVGQFVVTIVKDDPIRNFDGYVDREATKKKVLRDVATIGDRCFMTGDLVVMDEEGYIYFKDRIGDTYRWKSENVSTMEVESVISHHLRLADVVVYGVEVAGCEGRAGMAAIRDPDGTLSVGGLAGSLKGSLPAFALPVFIRVVREVDLTGTFKFNKVALKRDAFDPSATQDPLYFLDVHSNEYCKLSQSLYEDILNGQIRF